MWNKPSFLSWEPLCLPVSAGSVSNSGSSEYQPGVMLNLAIDSLKPQLENAFCYANKHGPETAMPWWMLSVDGIGNSGLLSLVLSLYRSRSEGSVLELEGVVCMKQFQGNPWLKPLKINRHGDFSEFEGALDCHNILFILKWGCMMAWLEAQVSFCSVRPWFFLIRLGPS